MRKMVESMMRFSWAMSVFGAQQVASAVSGVGKDSSADKVTDAFDEVTDATTSDFDKRFKSLYEAGEKMQHEMVELAFDAMDPKKAMERTSDFLDWAADQLRDVVKEEEDEGEGAKPEDEVESG